MLSSRYNPKEYEHIRSPIKNNPHGPKFCIIMPPPNVTGVLHLGHALTFTLQDILVRYKRLKGFDVLWQPGTDHAGIATQIVVENQLGTKKENLGKKAFLDKTWEWVKYSQDKIKEQQEKLGIAPNWERSKFTLDPDMNKVVTNVFVKLYKDGLLYRDKRLVNFDFKLGTALSDLEVVSKETKDKMYYIKYPIADASQSFITVATTRPETLFGDVALAIHPSNTKYQGKYVIIPLSGRIIPVITDEHANPEKGSGVVKITPAHDFNDFEMGKRHNLKMINILDDEGLLTEGPFKGMKTLDARREIEKVLNDLELLEKVEEIIHNVPFSERTGERIEPRLTTQWFCNMQPLAEKALANPPHFIPEAWFATYKNWLTDIQPWCVSRQLWWGHEIPAYYGPDDHVFVEETFEKAQKAALEHYGKIVELTKDQDVLDTWFSSALWPFSTLGWPDNLNDYFPTSVLITGFDIIFFWVARMTMMSYYCTGQLPFKDVYIHALVRDEKGNKMSKSKGNIIDPLVMIDQYGADALRLCLAALSVPGRDINLGQKLVETYSHFITKLWNAARFLNGHTYQSLKDIKEPLNQWILHKLELFTQSIEDHMNNYRFDLIVKSFYDFFWNTYCDIYLEGIKTLKDHENVPVYVFVQLLKVMNPVMPLVTAHLIKEFTTENIETWPEVFTSPENNDIDFLVRAIDQIRSVKGLLNLKNGLVYSIPQNLNINIDMLKHFLKASEIITDGKDGIPVVVEDQVFMIMVEDMEGVYKILNSHKNRIEEDMKKTKLLLDNERFKTSKPEEWENKKTSYEILTKELKTIQRMIL